MMGQNKISFLNRSFFLVLFSLAVVVFLFSACSSGRGNQVEVIVRVDVASPSGLISQVDSVVLEVSAPDVKTFERNLDVNAKSIKLKIPSGKDRIFTATVVVNGKSYRGVSTVDVLSKEGIEVVVKVEVDDYLANTTSETSVEETTAEETSVTEIESTTESTQEEEPAVAPTVRLEKIFGPEQIGDLRVYRYKAVVTGIPEPSIQFNHDDSEGAWGKNIAQVNLGAGETFTLKVVVENTEGTAEASVDISNEFQQDETTVSEESGSEETVQQTKTFNYISAKSGFVDSAGTVSVTGAVNTGDLDSGIYQRGFVIFDTSELEGKTVISAKLIYSYDLLGSPFPGLGNLVIGRCNYDPLDASDLDVSFLQIASFSGAPPVSISNDALKSLLQDVINSHTGSFQLVVRFSNNTNSDLQSDQFRSSGWKLEVTYE
ncbi:MAG: hypothetical protein M1371_02320 [Actinobacteria bacterium]|nr:hypothetical protein [Actinomycetota bacterium]